MVLIGTAILPHGTLPFDGDKNSSSEACGARHAQLQPAFRAKFEDLYEGQCRAGHTVASWDPDLVILSTPHGLCLSHSVGVYLAPGAAGSANWNDCWQEFRVDIELDQKISKELVDHFRDDGVPAEGILPFSGFTETDTLRWAEAVSLWYMLKTMTTKPKFIILSHNRSKGVPVVVNDQRLDVGHSLARFIRQLDDQLKVAVVISGDLSHVYQTDCADLLYTPDPRSNLTTPNHTAAVQFERAVQGWVKGIRDFSIMDQDVPLGSDSDVWLADKALPWLQRCGQLDPVARSCGLCGFIMLHALMDQLSQQNPTYIFKPRIETCQAPTYYGMMAASFQAMRTNN